MIRVHPTFRYFEIGFALRVLDWHRILEPSQVPPQRRVSLILPVRDPSSYLMYRLYVVVRQDLLLYLGLPLFHKLPSLLLQDEGRELLLPRLELGYRGVYKLEGCVVVQMHLGGHLGSMLRDD